MKKEKTSKVAQETSGYGVQCDCCLIDLSEQKTVSTDLYGNPHCEECIKFSRN